MWRRWKRSASWYSRHHLSLERRVGSGGGLRLRFNCSINPLGPNECESENNEAALPPCSPETHSEPATHKQVSRTLSRRDNEVFINGVLSRSKAALRDCTSPGGLMERVWSGFVFFLPGCSLTSSSDSTSEKWSVVLSRAPSNMQTEAAGQRCAAAIKHPGVR